MANTIKDDLKKRLSTYSKEDLIEAILLSTAVTSFVLEKCKGKAKPAIGGKKK